MRPISIHTGAWRYPGAWPDANFNLARIRYLIGRLEDAKFDAFFMADHLAVLNMPVDALKRSHTVTSFEPFTLLSALAMATERIGLVATASTTYEEPFHVARRFASLDHISAGRAGWNIVTTGNPGTAFNFGQDEHVAHADRYARAREFHVRRWGDPNRSDRLTTGPGWPRPRRSTSAGRDAGGMARSERSTSSCLASATMNGLATSPMGSTPGPTPRVDAPVRRAASCASSIEPT